MSLYRRFSSVLRELFPFRVYKLPLHAGFTCPNRDGSKATGGCIYCDNRSFSPAARGVREELAVQIAKGKRRTWRHHPGAKFIAYFQAYTNTYGPAAGLREIYAAATGDPDIVGISIGTRPDCAGEDVLDVVESLADGGRKVWVEYGLESSHDRTLALLNRCHTAAEFADAVERTARRGLSVAAHVILGLPGESREDMRETARFIARLPMDSVKIHHLYVSPRTVLEEMWRRGEVELPTLEGHCAAAADFLEILPERVSIQRVIGEMPGDYCLAPDWGVSKAKARLAVEAELARRGTRQGSAARELSRA